ncbi:hypothetical protein MUA77_08275 [Mammaliicoccus sciuri]|uniref:hypothetical protein n=1 Tax=Mammaliicoccus sciuri TaxID=1296 RepID=UPI0021CFE09E|nr:hypothetical protein [Mammaliicoccus sciuri]UXU82819.1 hypothetical protein MUA77_08275 [Mammaliicoccus sciuri]UXU92665.1 hypothetical protein MUA42_08285 [Mammaliicoccus sciuri]UXV14565.1 hypothetical protein MUA89_08285 [Mammaliicoccus sciuri]UXV22879.1 hypothetical protein MUA49_08280 [Mammaliicoccus sciuri]UXV25609.1 hypothetical protein MUA96_08280 [Mammaliicoccus sciuri]
MERLKQQYDAITPKENKVFIESFHGNNFSGDPKYIALYIKGHFPEKEVYVSSRNALVDMEIRNHTDYQNITDQLLQDDKIGTTENIVNFIFK